MAEVTVDFKGRDVNLEGVIKRAEASLQRLNKANRAQTQTIKNVRVETAASRLAYQQQRQAVDLATRSARQLGVVQQNEIRGSRERARQQRITTREAGAQERALNRQTRSVGRLGSAIQGVAFDQLATGLDRIASRADSFLRLSQAFRSITFEAGILGDVLINNTQRATKGLLSELDILQASNRALLLGLNVTEKSFGELARTAIVLGRAVGQGPAKSLDDLTLALGRGSPRILDNLGLIVKVGESNEIYARELGKTTAELTAAERQQAFFNNAMNVARDRVEALGGIIVTTGDRVQQIEVAFKDAADSVAGLISPAANLLEVLSRIGVGVAVFNAISPATFTRVVKGFSRMGTAIRGAGTALLGPAGIVVGLVGLAFALRQVENARQQTKLDEIFTLGQTGGLQAGAELLQRSAATYERIAETFGELERLRSTTEFGFEIGTPGEIIALEEELENLVAQYTALAAALHEDVIPGVKEASSELITFSEYLEQKARKAAENYQTVIFDLGGDIRALASVQTNELLGSLRAVDPLFSTNANAARRSGDALSELRFNANLLTIEYGALIRRQEAINEAMGRSRVSAESAADTITRIRDDIERNPFADAFQVQDIQGAFDTIFNTIIDDSLSFSERLRDIFRQLAREILSQLIFRQLAAQIVTALGGVQTAQTGGLHRGLTLVGEGGPEIVDFRDPARVYTTEELGAALGSGGGVSINFAPIVNSSDPASVQAALRDSYQEFLARIRVDLPQELSRYGPARRLARI